MVLGLRAGTAYAVVAQVGVNCIVSEIIEEVRGSIRQVGGVGWDVAVTVCAYTAVA